LEAVFVPKPENASLYIPPTNGSQEIISNGGVIQWISPEPNPVVKIDPTSGMPSLDRNGRVIAIRSILGYFTGTQVYSFPIDFDLTFYAEPEINYTFSHWLVDGEPKLGLTNESSSTGILPPFPDTSITIKNDFSKLEAVYSPVPEGSINYIDTTRTYYQEEVDKLVNDAKTSVTSNPSAYNLVTKSSYDQMMSELMSASDSNATHYTEGWFYLPSRGWMWTDRSVYPYFYDSEDNDWMYFQSGNEKPRFYRYKTKAWLTIE
jgi:hypothetical protein